MSRPSGPVGSLAVVGRLVLTFTAHDAATHAALYEAAAAAAIHPVEPKRLTRPYGTTNTSNRS